jgi:hypothetical protein
MSAQLNRAQRLVLNWDEVRPFLIFNADPALWDRFTDEMEDLREIVQLLEAQAADEEAWRRALL